MGARVNSRTTLIKLEDRRLSTLLTTLLIIDCLVLIILIVALQQGNEGGIGSAFGSENSSGFFGASGGVTFIIRATWVAGALFFIIATSLAWVKTREHFGVGKELESIMANPEATVVASPAAASTAATSTPTAQATATAPAPTSSPAP